MLHNTELGKSSSYSRSYSPSLLVQVKREQENINGYDIWRCFEVSWINENDTPEIATIVICYPANSPYIVESKSLKLYLGSFNFKKFKSKASVTTTIAIDLSAVTASNVSVSFEYNLQRTQKIKGTCIDSYNDEKQKHDKKIITTKSQHHDETVYSDVFRSRCPVTSQPDWATIIIKYSGNKIEYSSLIRYLLSFRNCNEFHEQCVSKIYTDIWQQCQPTKLEVQGCFMRKEYCQITYIYQDNRSHG